MAFSDTSMALRYSEAVAQIEITAIEFAKYALNNYPIHTDNIKPLYEKFLLDKLVNMKIEIKTKK